MSVTLVLDENGISWNDIVKRSDDKIIYISADGNDSWSGLSPVFISGNNGPKRNFQQGYNALTGGTSDQLLCRRGDIFNITSEVFINKSGRDPAQNGGILYPLLIGAYGTNEPGHTNADPRPILQATTNQTVLHMESSFPNGITNYVAIQSIHIKAATGSGIEIKQNGDWFLIEDCKVENAYQGITTYGDNASSKPKFSRQNFRRNVIFECDGGHGQGFFIGNVGSGAFNLDHNIIVDCGYPDNLSHSIYCDNAIASGSIWTISKNIIFTKINTSEGIKSRQGGTIFDNFVLGSGLAYAMGSAPGDGSSNIVYDPIKLDFSYNLALDITNTGDGSIIDTLPDGNGGTYQETRLYQRGVGMYVMGIDYNSTPRNKIQYNLFKNSTGGDPYAINFYSWSGSDRILRNMTIDGNVFYNMKGGFIFFCNQSFYSDIILTNNKIRYPGTVAGGVIFEHVKATNSATTFASRSGNTLYSTSNSSGWISVPGGSGQSTSLANYGAVATTAVDRNASNVIDLPDTTRSILSFMTKIGKTPTPATEAQAKLDLKALLLNQRRYSFNPHLTSTKINDHLRVGFALPILSPTDPTGLVVSSVSSGSVTLDWNNNPEVNISYYIIKYGTTNNNFTMTTTSTVSNKTVTGLTNGVTYYFIVRAVNTDGNDSFDSSVVSGVPGGGGGNPGSSILTSTRNGNAYYIFNQ